MRASPSLHDWLALLTVRFAKRRKPRFRPEASAEFYGEFFADEHLSQYDEDLRSVLRHEEIRRVVDGLPPGLRALDVGCGVGHILNIHPASFVKVGVDYSAPSLELARRRLDEKTALVNASAGRLPFEDNAFDLVTCLEVLEHLADDGEAVNEISRVLKPGGHLIASVPGQFYFDEYKDLMGHFRHYTPAAFAALLARHNIEVKDYLNEYSWFNFFYFYAYVTLEGLNTIANRLARTSTSLYERRVPLVKIKLYGRILAPALRQLKKLDERRGRTRAGTFVVARVVK